MREIRKAVAVDWAALDWTLSNGTLADILGVRIETLSHKRREHSGKVSTPAKVKLGESFSGKDDPAKVKVADCARLVITALATGKPPALSIAMLRKALAEIEQEQQSARKPTEPEAARRP